MYCKSYSRFNRSRAMHGRARSRTLDTIISENDGPPPPRRRLNGWRDGGGEKIDGTERVIYGRREREREWTSEDNVETAKNIFKAKL